MNTIYQATIGWLIGKILDLIFSRNKQNDAIISAYEKRLKENELIIKNLENESHRREQESQRVFQSIKRSGISVDKLVEKYDRPLNAILISYATQKELTDTGNTQDSKFVLEELKKYDAKYLGGTDAIIPPARVPQNIRNREQLKAWFSTEILKSRYCKLKFLILFDLRSKSYWETVLPYTQKDPKHFTLGEKLTAEDVFTPAQIQRIALGDIIRDGDIAWLASSICTEIELNKIHINQADIEKELGNPSLNELANHSITNRLSTILAKFEIKEPDIVSNAIIAEAQFWNSRFKRM